MTQLRGGIQQTWAAWSRFWFTPADSQLLAVIRILAGSLLFYTHLVWSFDLAGFFGGDGWLPADMMREQIHGQRPMLWSYFFYIESTPLLWLIHILSLAVFSCLAIGLFVPLISPLAFIAAVAYAQRVTPGAYFGLDPINCMLALYLCIGRPGDHFSVDAWLRKRRGQPAPEPSSRNNVAIRLIQVHMAVVYFCSALAKLQGGTWWNGTAIWWAVANTEYSTINLRWLADWPNLVAILTYATLFWELTYAALIWPRATRPWMLAGAVALHAGIGFGMGMLTFAFAMLIGNLAFVPGPWLQAAIDKLPTIRSSAVDSPRLDKNQTAKRTN